MAIRAPFTGLLQNEDIENAKAEFLTNTLSGIYHQSRLLTIHDKTMYYVLHSN